MGGSETIIMTLASVASTYARMSANRQSSGTDAAEKERERIAAEERRRADERQRQREQRREEERERARLQQEKLSAAPQTLATSGSGLLGQADVAHTGLKAKLGE
jgi:Ni/Co efflux regulator RcnB